MPVATQSPVHAAIKEAGLTVGLLAAEMDMDRSYLSHVLNGAATVSALSQWAPKVTRVLSQKLGRPLPVADLFPDLWERLDETERQVLVLRSEPA